MCIMHMFGLRALRRAVPLPEWSFALAAGLLPLVLVGPLSQSTTVLRPPPAKFHVGSEPLNVIAVRGLLWTENYGDGTVSISDIGSRKTRSISVGGQPGGIAFGRGSVWGRDLRGGPLTRVDPLRGLVAPIPGPAGGGGGAGGGTGGSPSRP